MNRIKIVAGVAGLALLGTGLWLAPSALQATSLLLHPDNSEEIVSYRLKAEPQQRLASEIEKALADDDPELAASLLEMALGLGTALPLDLIASVDEAQGFDAGRMAGQIWGGISQGDTSSEAALGGALAADFTGIGDARDIVQEGNSYLAGGTYDPVVLTLASAGLAATVATLFTAGAAAPARTGITILKAAKKADNLPAPLVAELITLSKNAIDPAALNEAMTLAKKLDLGGAGKAAGRVLRPALFQTITRTADDVAAIASGSGYRAVNQSLEVAASTADISKLRHLSTVTGTRFRGIVALLGSSALSLAGTTLNLVAWAVSGFIWLFAVALFMIGLLQRVFGWAMSRRKLRAQAVG